MQDLIERLEKATGPDRGLDRAVADLVFDLEWKPYGPRARKLWGYQRGSEYAMFCSEESVPQFTSSIDAALTLVPVSHMMEFHGSGSAWYARVWHNTDERRRGESYPGGRQYPAIALCIAALKARQSVALKSSERQSSK